MRTAASRPRISIVLACIAAVLATAAPGARQVRGLPADSTEEASEVSGEYRIQVGDQLDIKFFYNSELNEQVTVRPDGRISLQLIPEVVAIDRSARELTEVLRGHYGRELTDPQLSVIVRTFSAQRVYVGGEVNKPGELTLIGPLTVLQAVSRAEGFKETARMSEVLVIRRDADRTPLVMPVDVKAAIEGEDLSQDVPLLPYDVVFVPRSRIANVNLWMKQYITQNIPLGFGFRIELFR